MAITISDIRSVHPAFASTDHPTDAQVQSEIDRAERNLDETVLGDSYDDAVELTVCQALARSAFARDLRLEKNEHETVFDEQLNQILRVKGRSSSERFPA